MSEIDHRPAAGTAEYVSQGTTIEQSRAIAMVQAAYVIAQQRPRNIVAARQAMLESCSIIGMAERAFFSYSRGGPKPVTGPTVHLANELSTIWGNIQHGIAELDRDDARGFSEMSAYAVDLQANTRVDNLFRVVHMRDISKADRIKGKLPERLVDLRDIYENNTNMASRRERSAIFKVLPRWFTDEAEARCRETLKTGGNGARPLAERMSNMIDRWQAEHGITPRQLAEHLGKVEAEWDGRDVAVLGILFRSIEQNAISLEEAFPRRVRDEELPPAGGPGPARVVVPQSEDRFGAPSDAELAEAYEREREARQVGETDG